MPARRAVVLGGAGGGGGGGGGTTRRKHSLGNLRRAHPASGATWNVQVVRGKMSSKCLWHACRALVLGLTLMLLGAGMATLGYYADHLSIGTELRGNATVRVKNDLKGFHLNNFSYVGPIVMGFGGFIVVASCVMTFEARDSAAKVVPARLRASGGSKTTVRSNQSSSASQRRAIGLQLQSMRWDQSFGVFRSSPGVEPQFSHHHHHHHQPHQQQQSQVSPLDREALTAELIKFSKTLSASARFSPQLRRLTYTGSVPNLSTTHAPHPLAYSTNISHLLSPNHKTTLLLENKRHHRHHHRHHHHHHHHHHQHQHHHNNNNHHRILYAASNGTTVTNSNGRQVKTRGTRISNSLIQRTTRESNAVCSLLQPPQANRLLLHAASFDESARMDKQFLRTTERAPKRSDTAKRHILSRQRPIEQEEDKNHSSPLGNRRSSTMSDSSYSGRWTTRCASIASQASSIDSRRIQVDLHSPEVMPKSILRSPKRYYSGQSATPSVEKEFRSQLSVCSEPPPITTRQLSGQSSLEPCFPEESSESADNKIITSNTSTAKNNNNNLSSLEELSDASNHHGKKSGILKKPRPDTLPITKATNAINATVPINPIAAMLNKPPCEPSNNITHKQPQQQQQALHLKRSNSSRTFCRKKVQVPSALDDASIFYIRSAERNSSSSLDANDLYDSLKVINERRSTLLRVESETALSERKSSTICLMQEIPERAVENSQSTSIDIEDETVVGTATAPMEPTSNITLQMEDESQMMKNPPADPLSQSQPPTVDVESDETTHM